MDVEEASTLGVKTGTAARKEQKAGFRKAQFIAPIVLLVAGGLVCWLFLIPEKPTEKAAVVTSTSPVVISKCGLPLEVFVDSTTEWKRVTLRPGCRSHGARSPGTTLEVETDLGRPTTWVSGRDVPWLKDEYPHWYRVRLKEPGRPVLVTETFTPVR